MSKRPNLADITAAAGSTRRQPFVAAPRRDVAGPGRGGEGRPVGLGLRPGPAPSRSPATFRRKFHGSSVNSDWNSAQACRSFWARL